MLKKNFVWLYNTIGIVNFMRHRKIADIIRQFHSMILWTVQCGTRVQGPSHNAALSQNLTVIYVETSSTISRNFVRRMGRQLSALFRPARMWYVILSLCTDLWFIRGIYLCSLGTSSTWRMT
jgi:hypothetical protein